MAIVLRNNTARRQSFELAHDVVCTDDNCVCTVVDQQSRVVNPESGEAGVRTETVRVPSSIFISPRSTSAPLPESVLEVPAVKEALKKGTLLEEKHGQPPQAAVPTAIANQGSGGFKF